MDTQQQNELYVSSFTNGIGATWTFSVDLETGVTLSCDTFCGREMVPVMDMDLGLPMYPFSLELSPEELCWLTVCWDASQFIRERYAEELRAVNLQYTEHIREIIFNLWQMINLLEDDNRILRLLVLLGKHQSIEGAATQLWEEALDLDHTFRERNESEEEEEEEETT